ncbi:MAG: hypothetical protein PHI73_04075 [Patescibacteria group bacterium]|nr:hypothetical protein [Patescibacteria group bacterium]
MRGDPKKLYILIGILIGGILVLLYFILFPMKSHEGNININSDIGTTDNQNSDTNANINTNAQPSIPTSGPLYDVAKARDVKRLADIRTLFTALQSYYGEKGSYPNSLQDLVPEYLGGLPQNPTPGGVDYNYTPIGVQPATFFSVYYSLEVGVEDLEAGDHEATPQGIATL